MKFLLVSGSVDPDSKCLSSSHNVIVLGNFPVSLFDEPVSESGSCSATDITEGERDRTTTCSLAPDDKPESRMGCERSRVLLLLFLLAKAH